MKINNESSCSPAAAFSVLLQLFLDLLQFINVIISEISVIAYSFGYEAHQETFPVIIQFD